MPLTRCRCSMNSCPKISFWCARWKLSAVALAASPLPAPLPRPGPPCGAPVIPRSSSSSSVQARSSQKAPIWRITTRYKLRRSVRPRRAPHPESGLGSVCVCSCVWRLNDPNAFMHTVLYRYGDGLTDLPCPRPRRQGGPHARSAAGERHSPLPGRSYSTSRRGRGGASARH